jgi:hypothetical protein
MIIHYILNLQEIFKKFKNINSKIYGLNPKD